MTFNPDIHHRRSIRLRDYDYSRIGAYFVTICTWQRECLFGEITDGAMHLNDSGLAVNQSWLSITGRCRNVHVDEFIIMPNHLHGIIHITDNPNHIGAKQASPASPAFGDIASFVAIIKKGEAGKAFASPLLSIFDLGAGPIND